MGRVRLHRCVLNHRHEVFFFDDKIGFSKALRDVAGAQLEVLRDIGVRSRDDEIDFAIFGKVFVDCDRARFTGFLRVGVDRQIFVFDIDQFDRGLSDVFIFRRYRCHGFTDVAHFALSEKRFVLDRLAVSPGGVFACHHRNHAGQLPGLLRMDLFYFGVRFGTEKSLAVKHVGQHEIVAVNNLPRDFFVGIDPGNRFSDDCEIRHLRLLKEVQAVQVVQNVQTFFGSGAAQTARQIRRLERFERLELIERVYFLSSPPRPAPPG